MVMVCKSSDESSRTSQGYNYQGAPTAPPPGFKSDHCIKYILFILIINLIIKFFFLNLNSSIPKK